MDETGELDQKVCPRCGGVLSQNHTDSYTRIVEDIGQEGHHDEVSGEEEVLLQVQEAGRAPCDKFWRAFERNAVCGTGIQKHRRE